MAKRKNEATWNERRQRWQISVQKDLVRRTFTSSTPGRKGKITAERKADAWLESNTPTEDAQAGKLLEGYVDHLKATKSTTHYGQYEGFVRLYIKPVIGPKRMSKLTAGDLQDVLDLAYKSRGLSRKTLQDVRGCMMAWLKWCRGKNLTTLHPETLTIPKGAKKSKKQIVQPDGLRVLFATDTTMRRGLPRPEWYIHAFRYAALTGPRPGEVAGLEWSDVSEDYVTIRRAYNVHGEITEGKNDNAQRTIRLTDYAKQELADQREMLRRAGVISPYVFPDQEGRRTKQKNLYRAWCRYCEANGIPRVSLYELRHTYVSVNKKMPEGLKKLVVGHSRDMDTEGIYGHQMDGDLEEAASFSQAAFKNILSVKA